MSLLQWSQNIRDLSKRVGLRVAAVQSGRHQASGWIWDSTHLVTVEHILSGREETWVFTPEGKRLQAQVLGTHPGLDLALLRLESEVEVVEIASRSTPSLEVGEFALAVARSADDGLGVAGGLIACRSDAWTSCRGGRAEHFLQPDLQLYPGYSGGPLVDAEGQFLGINTRGLSRGQAITLTSETVTEVVELLRTGRHQPAYLGVGLQTVHLPEGYGRPSGAMVVSLELQSPAGRAGSLLGDILVELDGVQVGGTAEVLQELQRLQVGQVVSTRWIRAGQEVVYQVELGQRPGAGDETVE
ncbi:MAG: serine protease [Candidatus Eremiobacteraeota bacterium]|nr:serine protease [Candidatus Eremiobacteraeota bacterium]MCW5870762.1 serine protease [Candidatus Eremiobacteraeota bacterium]